MNQENFLEITELPLAPISTKTVDDRISVRVGLDRIAKIKALTELAQQQDKRFKLSHVIRALIDATPDDVALVFPEN